MTYKELESSPHVFRAYKTLILVDALLADIDLLEIEAKRLKTAAFKPMYSQEVRQQGNRFRDMLLRKFEQFNKVEPGSEIDELTVADQTAQGGALVDRIIKIQMQVGELKQMHQQAFDTDLALLCDRYSLRV